MLPSEIYDQLPAGKKTHLSLEGKYMIRDYLRICGLELEDIANLVKFLEQNCTQEAPLQYNLRNFATNWAHSFEGWEFKETSEKKISRGHVRPLFDLEVPRIQKVEGA